LVEARVAQPTRDAYSSAVYCEHVDGDGDHIAQPVARAVASSSSSVALANSLANCE
jgi:hypothetical protein